MLYLDQGTTHIVILTLFASQGPGKSALKGPRSGGPGRPLVIAPGPGDPSDIQQCSDTSNSAGGNVHFLILASQIKIEEQGC